MNGFCLSHENQKSSLPVEQVGNTTSSYTTARGYTWVDALHHPQRHYYSINTVVAVVFKLAVASCFCPQ